MSGTVNASIPMAGGYGPDMGAAMGQGIGNAQQLIALRQMRQKVESENALRNILGAPGAIDATGQPTSDAMKRVMAVDPAAGMKLQQNSLAAQEHQLRTDVLKTKAFSDKADTINSSYAPILENYETSLKGGKMTPAQADAAAQEALSKANEGLMQGGFLSPEDAKRLPTKWNPVEMRQRALGYSGYQDWLKQQTAEKRLDAQTAEQKKRDEQAATATGVDVDGNPIVLHPNAPPDRQATYLGTGQPVPQEKLTGAHKMGTGAAAAKDADNAAIEADILKQHPEWTPGQAKLERIRQTKQAGFKPEDPSKGWETLVDNDGTPYQHHKGTGENKTMTGEVYAPAGATKMGGPRRPADQDHAAIEADIKTEHPDWTAGQIAIEAKKRERAATATDSPARAAERDAVTVADSRIAAKERELGRPLDDAEKAEMRQTARADPKIQEAFRKQETTAISDEAATLTAEETLRGDWHGTVGMGRNAASMRKIANERARIAKEQGISGADLAANTAEFMGIVAAERVLGTRGAGIDLGIAEAQKFAPMVLELSDKIDRTRFPSINAMQLAIEKGTGGENVIRLTDALNAYKMAYTQILTRGGMPTDDSRRRSDEVIDKAWSNGQIHAAIDQLNKEMTAARSAVPEVRDNLYFALTGKKRKSEVLPTESQTARPGQPAGKSAQSEIQTITHDETGKAAYDQLAPGAEFISDGQRYRKPGAASQQPTSLAPPKSEAAAKTAAPTTEGGAAPVQGKGTAASPLPLPKTEGDLVDGGIYGSDKGVVRFDKEKKRFFPVEAR